MIDYCNDLMQPYAGKSLLWLAKCISFNSGISNSLFSFLATLRFVSQVLLRILASTRSRVDAASAHIGEKDFFKEKTLLHVLEESQHLLSCLLQASLLPVLTWAVAQWSNFVT